MLVLSRTMNAPSGSWLNTSSVISLESRYVSLIIDMRNLFSCGKRGRREGEETIGFACPGHKEETGTVGNWIADWITRRIFKISQRRRAISAHREGTESRAHVCVYILLRHAVMSRGPTWVFQLETRAPCVARPPRFDYSGCLFSRVKAAGLAWSHECFRQRAPSCSTC